MNFMLRDTELLDVVIASVAIQSISVPFETQRQFQTTLHTSHISPYRAEPFVK